MANDLNTLLTALYVKIDDELETGRRMGWPPQLTDSELVALAVAQTLLGFHSETRWLRSANTHLASMFPYLPQHSGYTTLARASTVPRGLSQPGTLRRRRRLSGP